MIAALAIFQKYVGDDKAFKYFMETWAALCDDERLAIAVEQGNVLSKDVAEADRYRDRLHGGLYSYVKSFLYDKEDAVLYEAASRVMRIMRQVGNPTRLTVGAGTTKLNQLADELEAYSDDLETIGATERLEKLMAANSEFVALYAKRNQENQSRPPRAVKPIRRKIDPLYKTLVNMVNLRIQKEPFDEFVNEMNGLLAEYNRIIQSRSSRKNDRDDANNGTDDPEETEENNGMNIRKKQENGNNI